MTLSFHGACREVTGSNILVETEKARVLLECGLFQGHRLSEERNYAPFPYDPRSLDAVIVGHAHLDHTGRLPKLVKDGFSGRIFSTAPTKELTFLVLEDNEKLMQEESARDNHPSLYDRKDLGGAMQLFSTIGFGESVEIADGIKLKFENAGHILGSAITILEVAGQTLIYTSDLGNTPAALLAPPAKVPMADLVICESTYGGRIHEDKTKRVQKLSQIIASTITQNSVLLIPSFAIERTQELLHDIDHFCTIEGCDKPKFFLDSPLAQKVTAVFGKYPKYLSEKVLDEHPDNNFFAQELLRITSTVDESKAIRDESCPKVIIAGSGMMNGGRILYHAMDYLEDDKNTLLVIGYQVKGTLGRRLLDGEKEIKIHGRNLKVKAQIKAIGSYSAHADQPQIVSWLTKIDGVKKIFLNHGEIDQAQALKREIKSKLPIDVDIPQQEERVEI